MAAGKLGKNFCVLLLGQGIVKHSTYNTFTRNLTFVQNIGLNRYSQAISFTLIGHKFTSFPNGQKVSKPSYSTVSPKNVPKKPNRVTRETDIAIIGGGAIGSSVAFWLKQRNRGLRIHVIERDDTVSMSCTL